MYRLAAVEWMQPATMLASLLGTLLYGTSNFCQDLARPQTDHSQEKDDLWSSDGDGWSDDDNRKWYHLVYDSD